MAIRTITGATGMLGNDLVKRLSNGHEIITTRVDIRVLDDVLEIIGRTRPGVVIHAAAFTDVDGAESSREEAYKVNALGTRNVTVASSRENIPIVYISTDYVFDGEGGYYEKMYGKRLGAEND